MSKQEREIKLPVSQLTAIAVKLDQIGARLLKPRHFEDNFIFDTSSGELRNQKRLLRVRVLKTENGESGVITFKDKPDFSAGVKSREEIESEVTRPENLILLLQKLGYTISFRYQKYRTVYAVEQGALEICVDETPIGNFLELEGETVHIHAYAVRLGFSQSDYIYDSYAGLYYRHRQPQSPEHMIFS